MGYYEYAQSLFLEKDQMKTRILIDHKLKQPILSLDEAGFVVALPEPIMCEEEEISFLGYQFPAGSIGKQQVARLLRACVFHLSAHVATSSFEAYSEWKMQKDTRLAKFSECLVEDTKANAYILARHPDKLVDIAFANSLAFERFRSRGEIWIPATRVMAASLLQANVGVGRDDLEAEERKTVSHVVKKLGQLKERVVDSLVSEQTNVDNMELKVVDKIYQALEGYEPVLEAPSLPHTEQLGPCTLFPQYKVQPDNGAGNHFDKCFAALGGETSGNKSQQTMQKKAVEAEALQVFDSWSNEKIKGEKTLGRHEKLMLATRFKSIGFPSEDYTEYLRKKVGVRSRTRRLSESLSVAFDALDEDPRKLTGVLDLQDIIQVVASQSPRKDVFMQEENISKSYAWIILLDASRSMRNISDDARNLGICLAETAKEQLLDPTSWGFYAFNDRFLILKDMAERYGAKTKARVGGLKFEGLTYMPDALQLVGELLKKRSENLRLVVILSDGWPYGYSNITAALAETLQSLQKAGIVVIGMGVNSNRMKKFFRVNCDVKSIKHLAKIFGPIYAAASRSAIGL